MSVFNSDLVLNLKIVYKNQTLDYCLKNGNLDKNGTKFKIRLGFM